MLAWAIDRDTLLLPGTQRDERSPVRNDRISSAALHCHCQIEQDYSAQNARVKISTCPNVHAKVHTFKFSWLFYGSWLQVMKIAKIWTSQNFTDMWYKKVCKCDQVPFPSFRLGPGDEGNKYLLWSVFPLPIGASSGSLFGVHNFDPQVCSTSSCCHEWAHGHCEISYCGEALWSNV